MASTTAQAATVLSGRDICLLNVWKAFLDTGSKNVPHGDADIVPFYNGFLEKCEINEIKVSCTHQKRKSDYPWKFDPRSNAGNVWAQTLARATLLTNFGIEQVEDKTPAACWDEAQETLKAHLASSEWRLAIDTAFYMTKRCLRMEREEVDTVHVIKAAPLKRDD